MLDDITIRASLHNFINRRSPKPISVIDELRIHEGNCIADVVAIYNQLHAFEIKGATDKISRVRTQAEFYNKSLPRITLVTTSNHLPWATKNSDHFWGIILASENEKSISLKYIRKSLPNPQYDINYALQILWRDELVKIFQQYEIPIKNKSTNRSKLIEILSKELSKETITQQIASAISFRTSNHLSNKGNM